MWDGRREASDTHVVSMPSRGDVSDSDELMGRIGPSGVVNTVDGGLDVVQPASTTRPA
jgi:hypothetical protein